MEKMTKNELIEKFMEMFPNHTDHVTRIEKIGGRVLAIHYTELIGDGLWEKYSRVFMYINENNWHFGTKLFRKKPEKMIKKQEESKNAKEETETVIIEEEDNENAE